jgi:hypothetical protein
MIQKDSTNPAFKCFLAQLKLFEAAVAVADETGALRSKDYRKHPREELSSRAHSIEAARRAPLDDVTCL